MRFIFSATAAAPLRCAVAAEILLKPCNIKNQVVRKNLITIRWHF